MYSLTTPKPKAIGAIIGATRDNISTSSRYSTGIQINLTDVPEITSYSAELIMGVATMQLLDSMADPTIVHIMDCKGAISKLTL
jgi:hypothetical protein